MPPLTTLALVPLSRLAATSSIAELLHRRDATAVVQPLSMPITLCLFDTKQLCSTPLAAIHGSVEVMGGVSDVLCSSKVGGDAKVGGDGKD